jgi:hypothetical protein
MAELTPWTQLKADLAPLVTAMARWAETPEGRVAIARTQSQLRGTPCACFCAVVHPGVWPCTGTATRARLHTSAATGDVWVPVCGPCVEAGLDRERP